MQQLVIDVTGKSFPDYMRENVLRPFGMTGSTYEQPLPPALAAKTATGYRTDRSEVEGRWHVYPEMAAAGLWTTPSDLARYAIGVQQALTGKSKVLSADMTRQMLTVQKGSYGLGPGIAGSGPTLRFSHGGRDDGFDALLVAYAETGDGVVIMINGNDNSRAISRIVNFIAKKQNWPDFPLPAPEVVTALQVAPNVLAAAAGRYEMQNNNMATFIVQNGRIYTDVSGLPDEEWVPAAGDRFVSTDRPASFRLVRNAAGAVEGLELTSNDQTRKVPRVGPLFTTSAAPDPDAAFTAGVKTVLGQFAEGGTAVTESKLLTAGARGVFGRPNPSTRNVRGLRFVHVEDVSGRGIERHGHAIARVLHYRLDTTDGERLLLVHVDADGLIGDYDIVTR
jgi:hypothetical protein